MYTRGYRHRTDLASYAINNISVLADTVKHSWRMAYARWHIYGAYSIALPSLFRFVRFRSNGMSRLVTRIQIISPVHCVLYVRGRHWLNVHRGNSRSRCRLLSLVIYQRTVWHDIVYLWPTARTHGRLRATGLFRPTVDLGVYCYMFPVPDECIGLLRRIRYGRVQCTSACDNISTKSLVYVQNVHLYYNIMRNRTIWQPEFFFFNGIKNCLRAKKKIPRTLSDNRFSSKYDCVRKHPVRKNILPNRFNDKMNNRFKTDRDWFFLS